jgi:hypothetical protein
VRIKTDENIGRSAVDLLRRGGHDVTTVKEQELAGTADDTIFAVCMAEQRTLITFDHDFAQVPRFPPEQTAGIAILELGGPASLPLIHGRLREFLALAKTRSINGELWIVEPGRVRVHLSREEK